MTFLEDIQVLKKAMDNLFYKVSKKTDLAVNEIRLLLFLHQNKELDIASEIVENLMISKSHVSYTVEKLKNTLKNRKKVFVAIKDNDVVGTAGIDVSWYNPDEYYVLTVFVKPENHGEGIGRLLIKTIENYAIHSNFKKLIIPASITAHEFYYKLGYRYKDNRKVLNEENMYLMEKTFQLEYREIKQKELPETK